MSTPSLIRGATWIAVRLGGGLLASGVSWGGVWLVGLLAGIGFTMSIFIANLGFATMPEELLMAKSGILLGSALAGACGIAWLLLLSASGTTSVTRNGTNASAD